MASKTRANLLLFMKSITLQFNPYARGAESIRLFQPYISPAMMALNPDCKVKVDAEDKPISPEIHIEYMNGMKQVIPTANLTTPLQIVAQINVHRQKVQLVAAGNEPEDDVDAVVDDAPKKDTGKKPAAGGDKKGAAKGKK
eukprot:TRINITY_DN1538_c0_g1_i1.p1 TRINITY_DN1538_c0_g1~~TRINITY_DN1538_c0_g1_i1.p1  ORF type:complete len:141 (+),score=34.97 TRINITY_DN1538_c0_g1_i1:116-538(+)